MANTTIGTGKSTAEIAAAQGGTKEAAWMMLQALADESIGKIINHGNPSSNRFNDVWSSNLPDAP